MKAAVLHELGAVPRYEDFPDPVAGDGEVIVEVKAVAVENVDKAVAAGTHFATRQFLPRLPAITGFDGIGALPDGRLVGFGQARPPYGALAERTVVPAANTLPAPDGIDLAVAVVLSSAVTGFAIKTAAGLHARRDGPGPGRDRRGGPPRRPGRPAARRGPHRRHRA
jgi:NADPH:quinone reductase-like Zn-dependent oxidoreductase